MSGEEEFIYVHTESDTDNSSISDDGGELFSEDFGSDLIEDTSSMEGLTIDSELEDSDDSFEDESIPEFEDEYDDDNGADGDDEEDEDDEEDYEENLPENLKRHNRSSVAFPPLTKRRRPSSPDVFKQLEELLERTNRQITNIYEAVSRMHEFCGVSQMERCKICGEALTPGEEAAQCQGNPEEEVVQPVAKIKSEKLDPDAKLESCDGDAQEINNGIISSDQPAVEAPLVFQQPVDSIPANDPTGMVYPVIVGIENANPDIVTPLVYIPPDLEIPEMAQGIIRNNNVTMNNPTVEENQESFNPPVCHNFDIPVIPEAVLVNNPETMNYPLAVENNDGHQNLLSATGPATDSEIKEVVLVEMPVKTEVIVDGNKQTVYCPALLGNVVPPDAETIATSISSETVIEKLVLVEMPVHPENILDDSPETPNNPIILQPVGDQELAGASFDPPTIELLDNEANNAQRTNNLLVLENDGGQTIPCCVYVHPGVGATPEIIPHVVNFQAPVEHVNEHGNDLVHIVDQEGYLGDPIRNIRLATFHLVTAKNKPTPTYAACYLANVIFSEEILLLSSVAERTSRCILMDQNKMSAIREYLLTVFPNYDLSEQGKDWKDCISAIGFMIESLYTEAEIPTNRNFSVPMASNWCARSNNDAGEGPSQWLQDVRESVKRERVEHTPGANPEGSDDAVINPDQLAESNPWMTFDWRELLDETPSGFMVQVTGATARISFQFLFSVPDTLVVLIYLGDPSRAIQIPYSVLSIAKSHVRPDLAAKYIILHLFPEEVLIESNVYGNMECGLFALDPNRIDALREFLQDNYPEYELEETGYHWKLCVTAINGCLLTLRQGPRNVVA